MTKELKNVSFSYRCALAAHRFRWLNRGLTMAVVAGFLALAALPKSDIQTAAVADPASAMCLSLNGFHEARGESRVGQMAVMLVTQNRVARGWRGAADDCAATLDPMQFSWANAHTEDTGLGGAFINAVIATDLVVTKREGEQKAWQVSQTLAQTVLANTADVQALRAMLAGSDHYLTQAAYDAAGKKHWSKHQKMIFITKIGEHRFYRWDG